MITSKYPLTAAAQQRKTALLLFARTPDEESRIKTFTHAGEGLNRRVAATLHAETLRLARRTGLPIYHISEREQVGETFGERYRNAFERLYARGYTHVLSIGSDCVGLTASDLRTAVATLEHTGRVIGPTPAGGAYVVGVERSRFRSAEFTALPWQTNYLLTALSAHLTCAPADYLPLRHDANGAAELHLALRGLSSLSSWRRVLRFVLAGPKVTPISTNFFPTNPAARLLPPTRAP